MNEMARRFEEGYYGFLISREATRVSPDVAGLMESALAREDLPAGRAMFEAILTNSKMAQELQKGMCQSPGLPCIYVRCGREMADIDVKATAGSGVVRAICDPLNKLA